MGKLTREELKKLREESRDSLSHQDKEYRVRILVHMGTCGIAAGARGVMRALLEELEVCGVKDVLVTIAGCAGLCSKEPIITIQERDKSVVRYSEVTPEKAKRIFKEHILEDRVVKDYLLAVGAEEG